MPYGVPAQHTTWCSTCGTAVGAVSDTFSNHRASNPLPRVWKTSAHKHRGRPCAGSRMAVPAAAVHTLVVQGS